MTEGIRGPYAKSARVQQEILQAALKVFAEHGFRGTTMKEVAHRAGISERGLGHHFSSKEELLAGVLDLRESEVAELVPTLGDIEPLLGLLAVARDNSTRPDLIELHSVLSAEATGPDHPAHQHHLERYDNLRGFITGVFSSLRSSGALVSPIDDATLASMLIGLQDGLQIQWLYRPESLDIESVLSQFLASIITDFEAASPAPDVEQTVTELSV